MMKTITLTTDIAADREITLTLPSDVPPGPADIVVVIAPRTSPEVRTFGDLLHSDFFGMWQDRTDIDDSVTFARNLRDTAWRRGA
jgi:hypothetical protein